MALEWVTRLLRNTVGYDNTMVSLQDAEFHQDGGVGLPYKFNPGMIYKRDYIDKYGFKLMDVVKEHPHGYSLPWDCFPKVEILPIEKARDKSRIICGAPVEHFLIGARLYTMFNKRMVKTPLFAQSTVGMVVPYNGWSLLYNRLPYMCENSDASRFDKSISPKLLKLVYLVRQQLSSYSDYELLLHWWYFNQLVDRRSILSHGDVYHVTGGNGSGQYNTTIDNTIAHMLAIAYAAYMCGYSYSQYSQLSVYVYGDDYIGEAMNPMFWYYFSQFGFIINKTKPQSKLLCDFLSNKFIHTPYGVTGIPVHDKALYSLYTSESKHWESHRDQKVFSLWLSNFFHPDRDIYEKSLDSIKVPYCYRFAVDYWFGRLEVLKSFDHSYCYKYGVKCTFG